MYVKAYLDLSLKSFVVFFVASWPVHLGAWPGGSWLPWRAVPCLLFACSNRRCCEAVSFLASGPWADSFPWFGAKSTAEYR